VDLASSYDDDTIRKGLGQLELQQVNSLSHDDVVHLEKMKLRTGNLKEVGKDHCHLSLCCPISIGELSPFAIALKIAIHKGHIAILIGFLQSTATSSQHSLAGLDFILDTLGFLTENLTARFASHRTQATLAEMVGKCTTRLRMHIVDNDLSKHPPHTDVARRIHGIVEMLFSVLGTIGDPSVISNAKAICGEYLAIDPACEGAKQALQKVGLWAHL